MKGVGVSHFGQKLLTLIEENDNPNQKTRTWVNRVAMLLRPPGVESPYYLENKHS